MPALFNIWAIDWVLLLLVCLGLPGCSVVSNRQSLMLPLVRVPYLAKNAKQVFSFISEVCWAFATCHTNTVWTPWSGNVPLKLCTSQMPGTSCLPPQAWMMTTNSYVSVCDWYPWCMSAWPLASMLRIFKLMEACSGDWMANGCRPVGYWLQAIR